MHWLVRNIATYPCTTEAYVGVEAKNSIVLAVWRLFSASCWRTTVCANKSQWGLESYPRCVSGLCPVSIRRVSGDASAEHRLQSVVALNH